MGKNRPPPSLRKSWVRPWLSTPWLTSRFCLFQMHGFGAEPLSLPPPVSDPGCVHRPEPPLQPPAPHPVKYETDVGSDSYVSYLESDDSLHTSSPWARLSPRPRPRSRPAAGPGPSGAWRPRPAPAAAAAAPAAAARCRFRQVSVGSSNRPPLTGGKILPGTSCITVIWCPYCDRPDQTNSFCPDPWRFSPSDVIASSIPATWGTKPGKCVRDPKPLSPLLLLVPLLDGGATSRSAQPERVADGFRHYGLAGSGAWCREAARALVYECLSGDASWAGQCDLSRRVMSDGWFGLARCWSCAGPALVLCWCRAGPVLVRCRSCAVLGCWMSERWVWLGVAAVWQRQVTSLWSSAPPPPPGRHIS